MKRVWTLVGLLLVLAGSAAAQLATTTVSDVVYRADGTPAGGSVVVSWGAFTTASGTAVTAGSTTATIGIGGVLTVSLAPNAGAMPMGSYYTAVFHLNDGTTTREYWVVPMTAAGAAPVKLAAIESQVLPLSVAMQTVSKQYVDEAIAQAVGTPSATGSQYVLVTGDTMTGPLVLPGEPVSALQAADKNYVDENVTAIASGVGQKVSLLPGATQTVVQPVGTQLQTNLMNGEVYATPYVDAVGNDGVANALGSAGCAGGCELMVEQTYPGTEPIAASELPQGSTVEDRRGGSRVETVVDPLSPLSGGSVQSTSINQTTVRSAAAIAAATGTALSSYAMRLNHSALTGGANQYPEAYETVPYFKSTYGALQLNGTYNTQGQHVQLGNNVNCYGVGDCLAGGQFIVSEGGYRDEGDEGAHPYDLSVAEDSATFAGSCASGCVTGSTMVAVTATAGAGRQGDGRYLIDKNPAKVLSAGKLIGGTNGWGSIFSVVTFSGTSFPVSVFLSTTQAAKSQTTNLTPGKVTLAIATSGVTAGFATNTSALPAMSGVACVADPGSMPNFETAAYTVIDGTHVQLTLNKVHNVGATIAVGGLCGYGLESTTDTVGAIRQVFPVVGSTSATQLYYAQAITGVIGVQGTTTSFLNETLTVASIARTGNVVTVTTAAPLVDDVSGLTMTVAGVADSSYNGSYAVTTTGPQTLTYGNTGANSTSTGGTVSVLTGGYALYPMAEVLSVYDGTTKTVDGTLTLAANTVAWASGDAVEEPHYPQQKVSADVEYVTQYVPRVNALQSAGKYFGGVNGPGLRGWQIQNGEPLTDYIGGGGTHRVPDDAHEVNGAWNYDFEVDAGVSAIVWAHCNLHGCGRWDSGYDLFRLDSAAGSDSEAYAPQSSTVTWTLDGTQYGFSPAAFTAGTINVGTLNATSLSGALSGASITSGTVSAARLPMFGASGAAHAAGVVPDPGATAGATRYLREDGTWTAPAGTSGVPSGGAGGDLGGSYPNPTVVQAQGGAVSFAAQSSGAYGELVLKSGASDKSFLGTFNDAFLLAVNRDPATGAITNTGRTAPVIAAYGNAGNANVGIYVTQTNGVNPGTTAFYANGDGKVSIGRTSSTLTGLFNVGATGDNFWVDGAGNVSESSVMGPAVAPSGSCGTNGQWVFSQDGHATFCASGAWVTKI